MEGEKYREKGGRRRKRRKRSQEKGGGSRKEEKVGGREVEEEGKEEEEEEKEDLCVSGQSALCTYVTTCLVRHIYTHYNKLPSTRNTNIFIFHTP